MNREAIKSQDVLIFHKLQFSMMALVIAAIMVMAMSVTTWAADPVEGDAKSITITSPSDLDASDTTTYYIYKVFNATSNGSNSNINYTKLDSKSLPLYAADSLSKFDADNAGNIHYYTRPDTTTNTWTLVEDASSISLSPGMISAIGTYVATDSPVETLTITGPDTKGTVALADYGYYYITTTTGTVVTIDSTNPSASVNDKNSIPSVDKKILSVSNNDTVEDGEGTDNDDEVGNGKIGDTVTYQVTVRIESKINVPNNGMHMF